MDAFHIFDRDRWMQHRRSPNYPTVSLASALKPAKVFWDRNGRAPVPRAFAVFDLGYSAMSGRSASVLSALFQYGLIESVARGQVCATQISEDIFAGPFEKMRRDAISQAARTPWIFCEIRKSLGSNPQDDDVRALLGRHGFTSWGIQQTLKNFKATSRFLDSYISAPIRRHSQATTLAGPKAMGGKDDVNPSTRWRSEYSYGVDNAEFSTGPLDFQLSGTGLSLTGTTASAKELEAFIAILVTLVPLLPGDESSDR